MRKSIETQIHRILALAIQAHQFSARAENLLFKKKLSFVTRMPTLPGRRPRSTSERTVL